MPSRAAESVGLSDSGCSTSAAIAGAIVYKLQRVLAICCRADPPPFYGEIGKGR